MTLGRRGGCVSTSTPSSAARRASSAEYCTPVTSVLPFTYLFVISAISISIAGLTNVAALFVINVGRLHYFFHFRLLSDALLWVSRRTMIRGKCPEPPQKIALENVRPLYLCGPYILRRPLYLWRPVWPNSPLYLCGPYICGQPLYLWHPVWPNSLNTPTFSCSFPLCSPNSRHRGYSSCEGTASPLPDRV